MQILDAPTQTAASVGDRFRVYIRKTLKRTQSKPKKKAAIMTHAKV